MGTWNFRTVKKDGDFAIYYAYYDDDGRLQALSECAYSPTGEDLEDLYGTLKFMLESFAEPPVDFDTLRPIEKDQITALKDSLPQND
jgi:hypothetical protein